MIIYEDANIMIEKHAQADGCTNLYFVDKHNADNVKQIIVSKGLHKTNK